MRIVLSILLIFLAPAAVSQTPPKDQTPPLMTFETPDGGIGRLYGTETLNENGEVETKVIVPPDLFRDTKLMDFLRKQGLTPVLDPDPQIVCGVDYSDIDAEEKVSDQRFMAMRGKVIPLQHQYEQELYYQDRRAKRYEETCGKQSERQAKYPSTPKSDGMTLQACKAIGVVCKPVKHW